MSYNIAIVRADVPADNDAAWALAGKLADEPYERASPEFTKVHAELTATFPCICELSEDNVDDGVWSDGPLIDNFGERIAVLGIVFSAVDDVLPTVISVASSYAMTVFDWQTETIYRPGDFVLTVEDEDPTLSPTAEELDSVIDRMNPDRGPGFAVLESIPSYVQTAGGDGLFTVEWRQYSGLDFQHRVAGKEGDTETEVEIPTNGYEVTVKQNECLNAADVKLIFKMFLASGDMNADFTWRDVTEQYK